MDLARLISNLIRTGTVVSVHNDAGLCRVASGDLTTNWIPWLTLRAGTTVTWSAPTPGEQVVLLSPEGETANAIALCGLYSKKVPAPAANGAVSLLRFADGALLRYDADTHALEALLPSGGTFTVTADGGTTINGPLTVNGETTLNGNTAVVGDTSIAGMATADVDVVGAGISLKGHNHPGVQRGNGLTDPPQ
ncbi:TPA: phage baseplate assembly protein V [Stenotrophomonas maltophilia]|nr:phage baseplate assembly protein V [Stenotrophomonas maltophilia]HEL3751710.1 phage baseplate assembly protein V [Stenotrophomonas maltophilia]HEL7731358.1 phage baseplate assembly protein V [Stenotrophomonas maltophilia]